MQTSWLCICSLSQSVSSLIFQVYFTFLLCTLYSSQYVIPHFPLLCLFIVCLPCLECTLSSLLPLRILSFFWGWSHRPPPKGNFSWLPLIINIFILLKFSDICLTCLNISRLYPAIKWGYFSFCLCFCSTRQCPLHICSLNKWDSQRLKCIKHFLWVLKDLTFLLRKTSHIRNLKSPWRE